MPSEHRAGHNSTSENTAKKGLFVGQRHQISIADVDAAGADSQITLSVTNGSLTLAGTTAWSFTAGDGTATPR